MILVNHGSEPFLIPRGDRIAQLVLAPVAQVACRRRSTRSADTRAGEGGFGSTG